jgi:Putative MetA-pathway of phenol degradation
MVRPILIAYMVTSGASIACAQLAGNDPPIPPIATDRPSVTDSSIVVPLGSLLQAENGFASTVSQGQRTFDGPETAASSGFGDLVVGMKQQLGPMPGGWDVSLVLSLSLPAGARAISSGGYDPSVQLPWSKALSSSWTVAGMLSVYWPTVDGRRNVTGESTFLVDRQLTKTWDAFVEYVGDFPERGGPRHLAHFGSTIKLTPRQQIDLHYGLGLSAAAVDHFIGVGYSFRLQVRR